MTLAFALTGLALLLTGRRRASAHAGQTSRGPRGTLGWVAGGAVAFCCVLLFGAAAGLTAAAVAVPLAALAVPRLSGRRSRGRTPPDLPLALDLIAAALRAGRPLDHCLELGGAALDGPAGAALMRVAVLLRLGADPDEAWRAVTDEPALAPVAVAARRSARSGIRLAAMFERLASQTRAGLRSAATARAQRVGVLTAAPLGLCFLPSFVCLGVAPVIIGIASEVLRGGP